MQAWLQPMQARISSVRPSLALGYGGATESFLAVGILLISVALYAYRRVVQDGQRIAWRIEPPLVPEDEAAPQPPNSATARPTIRSNRS
ncbi:hypothetical protein ABZS88_01055 [Streptomyces sp. NPDC005480]|uniref:hypothetical protein n=1 Tax=Streptomyces sp. NPDC005480 TaxID=3154880 RepID=UPI0033B38C73